MALLLPIAEAVAWGALDSVENLFINAANCLPWRQPPRHAVGCLTGRVAIVTGGNAGIGYATAKKLAQRGAHVLLACRSRERGQQAAKELSAVAPLPGCAPGSVEFRQLDLSSLKSVAAFAKAFNSSGSRLDVLVCNAGIMSPAQRLVTEEGLEMQFQVNFLSHWLLAHELLAEQRRRRAKKAGKARSKPARGGWGDSSNGSGSGSSADCAQGLGSSGCACGGEGTRLVMLSSLTHHAGRLQWHDKQSVERYSPFTSYALSKMCNTIAAAEFQRRFDRAAAGDGGCRYGHDSAVAIHPGIVHTHLATGFFTQTGTAAAPWASRLLRPVLSGLYPLVLRSPDSSADSMLLAACAPAELVAGRYLHNDRLSRPNKFAEDPERGKELWALAEELTGVRTADNLA